MPNHETNLILALVQPFGLQSPGGGSRILRAMVQNTEQTARVLSVCVSPEAPPATTIAREVHIPLRPHFGRVESTRFGPHLQGLGPLFASRFRAQVTSILRENNVTVVHGISHGLEFWQTFQVARAMGLPFVLNVHDDITEATVRRTDLPQAQRALEQAWRGAAGRMVISHEMGEEYNRRYGIQPYAIVTDGLAAIPDEPRSRPPKSLRVYFGGALHLSYAANFDALVQGLERFHQRHPDDNVLLTVRGGNVNAANASYPVRVLPWGTEAEVARDLEEADMLYLPLPFDPKFEPFCRYSLSTKMVTYLGSGLPILYHGPEWAAAGRLLTQHGAALPLYSLDPDTIADALGKAVGQQAATSDNALALARQQFRLADTQGKFWQVIQAAADTVSKGKVV